MKKELNEEEEDQWLERLMVYNEVYGDKIQGIETGIDFKDLRENYVCGVCSNSKEAY